MSYEDGMKLFKSANYRAAAQQFQAVTELDENNHKAWNALGICLSKVGEYESAATCFDNALAIAPDNATYKKNQAGNDKKRGVIEEDLVLDDEPKVISKPVVKASVSRPVWQYAIGIVGIFVVLLFVLGCMASLGGSGKQAQTIQPVVTVSPVQSVAPVQVTAVQTSDRVTAGEKNAARKAKSYLEYSAFSRGGLIHQLEFEKFSPAEAEYGVSQTGADWNEQAAKKAKSYLDLSSFSRDGLIKQLVFEKFTPEQAEYGVKAVGY